MVGFGFTLTGGSAQLIRAMSESARESLLTELFAAGGTNIGVSYLRISVGASDLNSRVFTDDDVAPGETDPDLLRNDVIPVLRQILSVNPRVGIMASPWTAPSWMKSNGDSKGGSLKRECFGVYARYLVKYLEAMRAEGTAVDALTIQN
jgi:glucosylceramidase